MKKLFISLAILGALVVGFLLGKVDTNHARNSASSTVSKQPAVSFTQYNSFFNALAKKKQFSNYKLVDHTVPDEHVLAVEKYLSFGKRSFVTTDGDTARKTGVYHATENRLYYLSGNHDLVIVGLYFTKSNLTSDYIGSSSTVTALEHSAMRPLAKKSDVDILNYKNVIISIQYVSANQVTLNGNLKINHQILNEINSVVTRLKI